MRVRGNHDAYCAAHLRLVGISWPATPGAFSTLTRDGRACAPTPMSSPTFFSLVASHGAYLPPLSYFIPLRPIHGSIPPCGTMCAHSEMGTRGPADRLRHTGDWGPCHQPMALGERAGGSVTRGDVFLSSHGESRAASRTSAGPPAAPHAAGASTNPCS